MKNEYYESEIIKLNEIFTSVDENKRRLIEGLIQDAAFLYAENVRIKAIIEKTGMVIEHPAAQGRQKTTEAAKQYLKNVNSYSVVIKALNGVLSKNILEDDDALDEWIKSRINGQGNREEE